MTDSARFIACACNKRTRWETCAIVGEPYPATKIKAKNGVTEWYLDKVAAKLL